jgi:hypothetical protein
VLDGLVKIRTIVARAMSQMAAPAIEDPVPVLAAIRQCGQDQEGRLLHRTFCHNNGIYR